MNNFSASTSDLCAGSSERFFLPGVHFRALPRAHENLDKESKNKSSHPFQLSRLRLARLIGLLRYPAPVDKSCWWRPTQLHDMQKILQLGYSFCHQGVHSTPIFFQSLHPHFRRTWICHKKLDISQQLSYHLSTTLHLPPPPLVLTSCQIPLRVNPHSPAEISDRLHHYSPRYCNKFFNRIKIRIKIW